MTLVTFLSTLAMALGLGGIVPPPPLCSGALALTLLYGGRRAGAGAAAVRA